MVPEIPLKIGNLQNNQAGSFAQQKLFKQTPDK